MSHRAGKIFLALAAALLAAIAVPAASSAHALLLGADPADGSHLSSAPRELRLSFSEEISTRFRSVQVVAPNGKAVAGTRLQGSGKTLAVEVARLPRGTYAVVWRVLAEDDGHTTSGTVVFGVGVGVAAHRSAFHEPSPSLVEVSLRWSRFAALAVLLGCLALAYFVLTSAPAGEAADVARRRVLSAAALGGGAAALIGVAGAVREISALGEAAGLSGFRPGLVREVLLSSRWGHLWCIEEIAVLELMLIALSSRRDRSSTKIYAALASVGAAVIVVCEALGSHAASVSSAAVAADALHVLAAAVWLGAVAGLAVAIWPTGAVGADGARALVLSCRRRFGMLAGAGVIAVALTGLYSAGREIASIDGLLTTLYGRALLAKTGVVVLALLLGAANALLLRKLARSRRRSVLVPLIAAEALAGAGIFLGAGVLAAAGPARGPQFAAPRPARVPTLATNVDDVLVSGTVRPNRPGENIVTVQAISSRRPPPAPVTSVHAWIGDGVGPVELRPVGLGRYVGTVTVPRAGPTRMTVLVRRGAGLLRSNLRWSIDPADPARPVVVSSRRLSTIVDPLVLALIAGLAIVGGLGLLRRTALVSVRSFPLYREESS